MAGCLEAPPRRFAEYKWVVAFCQRRRLLGIGVLSRSTYVAVLRGEGYGLHELRGKAGEAAPMLDGRGSTALSAIRTTQTSGCQDNSVY